MSPRPAWASSSGLVAFTFALLVLTLAIFAGNWGTAYGQAYGGPTATPTPTPTPTATVIIPSAGPVEVIVVLVSTTEETTSVTEIVTIATTFEDKVVEVIVPPGAAKIGSIIQIAIISNVQELQDAAPPSTTTKSTVIMAISAVVITSTGETSTEGFTEPVPLSFDIPRSALPENTNVKNLVLAFLGPDGKWVYLPTEVTIAADGTITIVGFTLHFTVFAIISLEPGVLEVPPPGGLSVGVSGTNDPDRFIEAQSGTITSLFILEGGTWLAYIPGAPDVVNSIRPGTIGPNTIITAKFAGPIVDRIPTVVTPPPSEPAAPARRTIVVPAGGSLRYLSALYGVDWNLVALLNGITGPDYNVQIGQVLEIPDGFVTITVQSGENLSTIGDRVGLNPFDIAALNGIEGPDYAVQPGYILWLPGANQTVVRPEEILSGIAVRVGVPWPDLAAVNGIVGPDYRVQPGQVLTLP